MIERVTIENFKPIGRAGLDLDLAPLTIFVGPNGSGKSSVLEATALLAQSVDHSGPVPATRGRLVNLGDDVAALYHDRGTGEWLRIGVTVALPEAPQPWPEAPQPCTCTLALRGGHDPLRSEWSQGLRSGDDSIDFAKEVLAGGAYRILARMKGSITADMQVNGTLERLLDVSLFAAAQPPGEMATALDAWRTRAAVVRAFLASPRIRYVSALRGGPLASYKVGDPVASASGRHGVDAIRVLSRIRMVGSKEQTATLDRLAARFGLADFRAGSPGGELLLAEFEERGVRLPVAHAGFGSQQALPVIADLVDAEAGSTVMIEEIEHSCHPRWVQQWGRTLAEVVGSRQIQVLATTHAPDLVLAVRAALRRGPLLPRDVAIYQFDREDGQAVARRQALDETGRFRDGWIETFATAEAELFEELLGGGEE